MRPKIILNKSYKIFFFLGKARYKKYMKLCKDTDSTFLTPNWDVPTRWNSTYKMFLCGLCQKDTLQVFHDLLASKGSGGVIFGPKLGCY